MEPGRCLSDSRHAGRSAAQDPPQIAGRWDGTVVVNKLEIPFAFEIVGAGPSLKGSFFNGERRITSTSSRFENGMFVLSFDQYASRLQVTYRDGQLSGEYLRARGAPYPFRAVRATAAAPTAAGAPSIAGSWIFSAKSNKGETAFRFLARQTGADVSATDPQGRWRYGHALGHLAGWPVRPEPFLGSSANAPRGDSD